MFAALNSIIGENEEIHVRISGAGKDGRMKVIVMPKAEKGTNLALAQPLALAATPQELDAGFVGTLMEFGASRYGLKEQVAVTATIMAAAQQSEAGKATKALQSKGSTAPAKASAADPDDDSAADGDDGNGFLDEGTSASAPAARQAPPAPVSNNDDLLSLLSA